MRFFAGTRHSVGDLFRRLWDDKRSRAVLIVLPIVLTVAALAPYARGISEDIMFAIDPTAERGYRYGTLHMSGNNPHLYDIKRAQKYLEAGREIDPTFPVINYQLARIYFIQGHYIRSLMSTNAEIMNAGGDPIPQVYYMKGLIEGTTGHYDTAAADYKKFLELREESKNGWAGYNDYAWVLLKGGKTHEALDAINAGLKLYPGNAWLLTIQTSTLFELGRLQEALVAGEEAIRAADALTEAEWRSAYPGNNPSITPHGLRTIRSSTRENLEKIKAAIAADL